MKQKQTTQAGQDWNLMLVAMSEAAPAPLLEHLSHAIVACGGWVLSHGEVSKQCADIDFEFPRAHAMEIYCLLVGAGVELSLEAHGQLAALCHCTRQLGEEERSVAARVNLSVYARAQGEAFLGDAVGALPQAA